ncbi:MAG: hypothetical protein E7Z63_00850 [Thermoplasmata archaeon]|nr:hypothetical protein [Thermoplasmata archaeon]
MFGRTRVAAVLVVAFLAALTTMALAATDASDAATPTIEIQEREAAPDTDVTFEVYIQDNPGICDIHIDFLISGEIEVKKVTSDLMNVQEGTRSGTVYSVSASSGSMMSESGTLMTLTLYMPDRDPNAVYCIYANKVVSTPSFTFDTIRGTIYLDMSGLNRDDDESDDDSDTYLAFGVAAAVAVVATLVIAVLVARR